MSSLQLVIVVGGILGFGYFAYVSEKRAEVVAKQVAEREAKFEARRAAEEWLSQFGTEAVSGDFRGAFDDGPRKEGKEDE